MAETTTPPAASSAGTASKLEKWAGSHKVIVGAAGLGGAFLLLSHRGTKTIQGEAVAPTDESSVNPAIDTGGGEGDEPSVPDVPVPDDTTPAPADDTPVAPVVAPPPPPPPAVTAPPAPAPVTPRPVAPTLSTVPAQTSPSIAAQVKYDTVPGYYSVIYTYDSKTGDAYEWHHYTSGTRAGDKIRVQKLGNYGKGITASRLGNGFAKGTLGLGEYERYVTSVQYESTQVARVTTP